MSTSPTAAETEHIARAPRRKSVRVPLAPTLYDKLLAAGALGMLAAILAALARGSAEWAQVPAVIWAHIFTILVAMVLTPFMMLRARGDRLHRTLGWVWCSALFLTAADSLLIKVIRPGQFSYIHVLSIWTMIQVPLIVYAARRHDWKRHRTAVRSMVTGALLIAGFFTFPFNRLMGNWLFG